MILKGSQLYRKFAPTATTLKGSNPVLLTSMAIQFGNHGNYDHMKGRNTIPVIYAINSGPSAPNKSRKIKNPADMGRVLIFQPPKISG
jgi:hypothetical protein